MPPILRFRTTNGVIALPAHCLKCEALVDMTPVNSPCGYLAHKLEPDTLIESASCMCTMFVFTNPAQFLGLFYPAVETSCGL
jgi:hypothetical protein